MKTNYYIGFLSALLLSGMSVKAQYADNIYHGSGDAGIVVNNYYDNYDYYYSSRINRFHRSYTTFSYYSPVFTETYWYTYNPYSWGISIYSGGTRFSPGYSFGYPVFPAASFYYDYRRYDPFYYSYNYVGYPSWYYNNWVYDPYIYNYWYTPYGVSINFSYNLSTPCWGWNYHYYDGYYHRDNDNRPVYYSSNSVDTDVRSLNQAVVNEDLVSGSRRQKSVINYTQSIPTSGARRTSSEKPVSESNAVDNPSGNNALKSQAASRRSITEAVSRNTNVSIKSETRRSSSLAISGSSEMNQPSVKREIPDYSNQNRSLVTMAKPSYNETSQPYTERRTQERSNTDIQRRNVPDQSVPAINSRRENSVLQSKSSGERDHKQPAGDVPVSKENGRRK